MTTTTSTARATILIVDDHPVMRRGLSQVVEDEVDMQVCGCIWQLVKVDGSRWKSRFSLVEVNLEVHM